MDRKTHIESIMQSMRAIRQKFASCATARMPRKSKRGHITSSQWAALAVIMHSEHIGIKELSTVLHVSSSAATQLVDELVKKGCLMRKGGTEDRRTLALSLSPSFKAQIKKLRSERVKQVTSLFSALTDKELEQYAELSRKIAHNDKK